MILYVNGDSHSAGAVAVNSHCFAEDDPLYYALGRQPHPDNLRVSYGAELANHMGAILDCDAESASSNYRIIRTTHDYLKEGNRPDLIVIGWATWEREEWLHNSVYYQVNASGTDSVPEELQQRYKDWVLAQDDATRIDKMEKWHQNIFEFHTQLLDLKIPHLFFNTAASFKSLAHTKNYNWQNNYLGVYDDDQSYSFWLKSNGFKTVSPTKYHFRDDAHAAWAEYLYNYIVQNSLLT